MSDTSTAGDLVAEPGAPAVDAHTVTGQVPDMVRGEHGRGVHVSDNDCGGHDYLTPGCGRRLRTAVTDEEVYVLVFDDHDALVAEARFSRMPAAAVAAAVLSYLP